MTTALFALALTAPAGAAVPHTVVPGETLWTIASASNLTTRTLAVFNGLNENSNVVLGSTILIPSIPEGVAALQKAGLYGTPWTDGSSSAAPAPAAAPAAASPAPVAATPAGAPKPLGGYTVRSGDSLSALAASSRVSVRAIAAMNGLDPAKPLLAGTVIKLPTGAPTPPNASQPEPATKIIPAQGPAPTPTRVGAADIAAVANAYGVSPSLASAIAWQESGFNNAMVSSANARGVMQVMPGTWQHVQDDHDLAPPGPELRDGQHRRGRHLPQAPAQRDRRRRGHRDRRLLPGSRRRPLPRPLRRHQAVRRERPGAALALRRLTRSGRREVQRGGRRRITISPADRERAAGGSERVAQCVRVLGAADERGLADDEHRERPARRT